jgi:hypothetical protein
MMLRQHRRILILLVSLTVISYAVYAELKKGNYSRAELGAIHQAAKSDLSTDSVYEVPSYPVPALELAPGEGRSEVQIYCNTCHSPRYIPMQPPLPAEVWEAEVNKMDKTLGANIPEASKQKIIHYLQQHYTPENRKP